MKDINFRCYKKLYIAESSIHGMGLFSSEPILAGDIVFTFGGVLAKLEDRYSGKYLPSTFAGIAEEIVICEDSYGQKDFSDYINHSCEPNLGMDDCLTVVAISDILPDTELTYDYAFCEADPNWNLKATCNCGSKKCRVMITGNDWRFFSPESELFPYFSPFIKRRIVKHEK